MKIGILGGSFDPIHRGHLQMARIAQEEAQLDLVLFLPARLSPFKSQEHAPALDRWAMTLLATEQPSWRALRWELERPEPSYSIETLLEVRALFPEARVSWIIGADNLPSMGKWHRAAEFFAQCSVLVAGRDGWTPDLEEARKFVPCAQILRGETPPISSSEIRARILAGEDVSEDLHPTTWNYIHRYGLYGQKGDLWLPPTRTTFS